MGVAIISVSDYYRQRDFDGRRKLPCRDRRLFAGFFASLDHMNEYLETKRKKKVPQRKRGYIDIS